MRLNFLAGYKSTQYTFSLFSRYTLTARNAYTTNSGCSLVRSSYLPFFFDTKRVPTRQPSTKQINSISSTEQVGWKCLKLTVYFLLLMGERWLLHINHRSVFILFILFWRKLNTIEWVRCVQTSLPTSNAIGMKRSWSIFTLFFDETQTHHSWHVCINDAILNVSSL